MSISSSNNDLLVHSPTRVTMLGLLWQVPMASWILEMALGIACWLSTTRQLTKRLWSTRKQGFACRERFMGPRPITVRLSLHYIYWWLVNFNT